MRAVFAALHPGYYRNLESVVAALAARGHEIYLGSERPVSSALGGECIVERLTALPNVVSGPTPRREKETFYYATKVRLALDYLRYLEPEYAATEALRRRSAIRTANGILWLSQHLPFSTRAGRGWLQRALDRVDRAIAPSPAIEQFFDEMKPDVLLVTPLVGLVASSQLDLLRAAQARRIPTGVCVWSWDHLSSKAIIRDWPDRLFVWNDIQKQEAVDMHGLPPARVVVTGAQNFDQWFDRAPARDRAAFAARVGLPDDRPFVLWVCSALFPGSPSEADFVMGWIESLRSASDPALRDVSVLIRPHPSRAREWEGLDWARFGRTALWGGNPIDAETRNDYFDSLYHSAAVVGLNTSAFIEAGIVGRPVLAILPEEFRENQEGTLHFHYLQTVGGGLLTVSRSLSEHADQLRGMLARPPEAVLARQRQFVTEFVRPRGLHLRATDIMAGAIEELAALIPEPVPSEAGSIGRAGLRVLRVLREQPWGRRFLLDERELPGHLRVVEQDLRRDSFRSEKAARREHILQKTATERRAKSWNKWRRGLSARKRLARLKGEVKHLMGMHHQ